MTKTTDQERAEFDHWFRCYQHLPDDADTTQYDEAFLAFKAWQAARSAPAAPVPKGWKLVPVSLLERIQESLGSFVSDQEWTQSDMDTADALDGLLARDLNEDTDPDDEAFDDFAEDVEDNECHNCSGTGEGMYDGQSCVVCLGKGFL